MTLIFLGLLFFIVGCIESFFYNNGGKDFVSHLYLQRGAEGGVRGMDAAFAQAVLQSARILNECPEHQAYFRALGRYFERLRSWN